MGKAVRNCVSKYINIISIRGYINSGKLHLYYFFCYHGKLSHKSSGQQVPLSLPYPQTADASGRWCFIALQRAMDVKNPTVSTAPSTCLAIPRLACHLIHPITVFATAFYSITPYCDFVWDSLFHKIIQQQSSYIYIHKRKKSSVIA